MGSAIVASWISSLTVNPDLLFITDTNQNSKPRVLELKANWCSDIETVNIIYFILLF